VFRDFIYLDINRVQSIIAQLQQGLLNQVMEGKTEQTTGRMQMAMNLLAMLLPVSASGTVEHSRAASLSESRVLHDYAFEVARRSLEEGALLLERDDLDWDDVPESGFVLVRGTAQILDYQTMQNIAKNFDDLDEVFNPSTTSAQRKKRKQSEERKTAKEMNVVIDAFFKDTVRVKVTNSQGCGFIGPLAREHLREDIRNLIYKYGSNPIGEWVMLADVSRVPLPEDSSEGALEETRVEEGESAANQFDQIISTFNAFQEFIGSVSYPDVAVSPIAVYREVG
jgi:hypothetical protein